MALDILEERLRRQGISPAAYAINADRDETYCLVESAPGRWVVYYSERGHRSEERAFTTESAACRDVLERLVSDPTARADYRGPSRPV